MTRAEKKARNELLARAMRANGLSPQGEAWEQAKGVRDTLIEQGTRAKSACNKAAFRVARGQAQAQEFLAQEPVTQAPAQEAKTDARPKRMPEQAKRVQEGKVMRDSRGRILPAYVQEAYAELRSLNA